GPRKREVQQVVPWRAGKAWYAGGMSAEMLQARVEAIRATSHIELMHMTCLRLGRDLRAHFNKKAQAQELQEIPAASARS
ncbi:MAG TPA: hypothetical protein VG498_12705, partial [Terriglobales bacterium]|nr:hypothetical protein [Terriglobales bacterium]